MTSPIHFVSVAPPALLAVRDPAAWIARRGRRIAVASGVPRGEAVVAAIADWARFVPASNRAEVCHGARFDLL